MIGETQPASKQAEKVRAKEIRQLKRGPKDTTVKVLLTDLLLSIASVPLGSRFVDTFNEMRCVQWFSKEELHDRSERRLGLLLKHAAENVPYYRTLYRRLGLKPDELRTIDDLKALPIFKKSLYRELDPETLCASGISSSLRIDRQTSGSTGEPFQFSLDRRALPVIFASHLFYDSWHGQRPFDRYTRIVAPPAGQAPLATDATAAVRMRRGITDGLQKFYENRTQQKIWLSEVDVELAQNVWHRIEAFQPKFVMGYTSTLAAIANELLRCDLRLSRSVRGVIVIAETLTPNRRRLIHEYFAAPIINRYGLREFGSWSAQSCRESPNQFHINTELVVYEVLRHDGTSCAAGEIGRVVLTDLHNFARPFIRYETGDLAVAVSENCSCSCGRGFPLFGPVEGRALERLQTPSGGELNPTVLGHVLCHDNLEVVRQYQLVQESTDRVRLLVVPGPQWNEQQRARIQSDLTRAIGAGVAVAVKTMSDIPPEKSGKRPIIKHAA